MSAGAALRLHAIYVVLDEVALFPASLASIYPSVARITVITAHDRDWAGRERPASGIVATVLDRECDPERKIDLIVVSETNEARARNRAMDFAAPRTASLRVQRQHLHDPSFVAPDYFLIVDADEIYEAGTLERLAAYVSRDRKPLYRVPCVRYFKRWNYRIDGYEWTIALVRADQRLPYLRMRKPNLARRGAARVPGMPLAWRQRLLGYVDIPPSVGVFHHGSYVGPRSRIEAKLQSFGHAHEVDSDWMARVWDAWTPDARDFNPAYPDLFPRAQRIDLQALPEEIAAFAWPSEYLEL